MNKITDIEQLTEDNLEAYLRLAHGFLKSTFHLGIESCDDFVRETYLVAKSLLSEPNTISLVARKDDSFIGYLAADFTLALHLNGYECHVRELYVEPSYRRQGIGSLLMKAIESLAIQKRCKRISLATNWNNDLQKKFYKNHGFDRRCDFVIKRL